MYSDDDSNNSNDESLKQNYAFLPTLSRWGHVSLTAEEGYTQFVVKWNKAENDVKTESIMIIKYLGT